MKRLLRLLAVWRRHLAIGALLTLFVGCNLDLPTLGGRQFWADVAWSEGWRVQQHVLTGHSRLLDPGDTRRAWGPEEFCIAKLPAQQAKRLVILLHGLGRTRFSMDPMRRELEAGGECVASFAYPSTRASIDEHAAQLEKLLNRLEGLQQVAFVTHSLGGRVLLRLLEREGNWMERIEVDRIVQLAPPNGGSSLARQLAQVPLVSTLMGPSFMEVRNPATQVPPPGVPVGVVAGCLPGPFNLNPLLAPGNDGVLTVPETRPAFSHEFLQVRAAHTFLMNSEQTFTSVQRFLNGGELRLNSSATRF